MLMVRTITILMMSVTLFMFLPNLNITIFLWDFILKVLHKALLTNLAMNFYPS
jgi:hypothetical protein